MIRPKRAVLLAACAVLLGTTLTAGLDARAQRGCSWIPPGGARSGPPKTVDKRIVPFRAMNGVSLGMSRARGFRRWGQPLMSDLERDSFYWDKGTIRDGCGRPDPDADHFAEASMHVNDSERIHSLAISVDRLPASGPVADWHTGSGIRLGSSLRRVKRYHDVSYVTEEFCGRLWAAYKMVRGSSREMQFCVRNKRVTAISVISSSLRNG